MRKVGDGSDDGGDEETSAAEATATDESASEFVVPTETENDRETEWRRALAEAGELTPDVVDAVATIHDKRGVRAIEAVSEGRVKRYRDFTVVVGHAAEYVVEDGGCTCKDSSYNLDPEDDGQRCWHVLAAAVAERIGEVDHHDMWYSDVREFI
ncbi:hypothetical protein GL213_14650 [Halogeometricum borinquense]|uniref:Uncharacterized protein n=1 Tax=Halogeometricum borinquense TaxID=60847 RepID=A0A6C0UCF6_9EURY|nr:SWIM zinc finger family protein [Halogeometricum borinquense]QIB72984.1 hypothetical protein G3I44_01000 [Halogeometricum borinquense]QIQ77648.1 hypothetical protein GL213_14650 [Halogeometricum borinquense]